MDWVTIVWTASAAVSLTLGAIQLIVWLQNRRALAHLAFSVTAVSVACVAMGEVVLMHTASPQAFGEVVRWIHVPIFFIIVGVVLFVGLFFGTGRWWLAGLVIAVRLWALVQNFLAPVNLNYREIRAMEQIDFLGRKVWVVARGVPSGWNILVQLSFLLAVAFVVDASLKLCRTSGPEVRRRAIMVGGSTVLFFVVAPGFALLIHFGFIHAPYLISLPFLAIVAAMSHELSREVARAARLTEDLRESAVNMDMAAAAAQLVLWRWDVAQDRFWLSANGRAFHALADDGEIRIEQVLETIHPGDREQVRRQVADCLSRHGSLQMEYRVPLPDGTQRWIAARGTMESTGNKHAVMRGVSVDITERRNAEIAAAAHHVELARLSRVSTLSEFSGSLAHEINQPLTVILSNAQAAQRLLGHAAPDLEEIRKILADIVAEDRRAATVIQRLRSMLERGDVELRPLELNQVIKEALSLVRTELRHRGIEAICQLDPQLPSITGDRVQLQQVFVNLLINAAEAVEDNPPGSRVIRVRTSTMDGRVVAAVVDEGHGLPADRERLFEPFFTTKTNGLGMGLAICRSIVEAHHGRIHADAAPVRGAVFRIELPASTTVAP